MIIVRVLLMSLKAGKEAAAGLMVNGITVFAAVVEKVIEVKAAVGCGYNLIVLLKLQRYISAARQAQNTTKLAFQFDLLSFLVETQREGSLITNPWSMEVDTGESAKTTALGAAAS
ncbi:hypothetical protein Tco_0046273 [Tanacetum coccineum]